MAIKDGIAVTCWHMVHDAKSVTAGFSDGEVYDVVGLIDHDAVNDVALVKVKATGRPLLTMQKDAPEIGAKALAIGAPLGADFTISDGIISQIRHNPYLYQFTCPSTHGNSGGPLLDENGQVIGIVSEGVDKSNANLGFAVPIKYALNLDESLPVVPWRNVKDDTPSDNTDNADDASPPPTIASNDDLDKLLGTSTQDQYDSCTLIAYLEQHMLTPFAFQEAVPSELYILQDAIKQDLNALSSCTSADSRREQLRTLAVLDMQHTADSLNYFSKAILSAQSSSGWSPEAKDLESRAIAALGEVKPFTKEDQNFLNSSKAYATAAPDFIRLATDTDTFRLGISYASRFPLVACSVDPKGIAGQLGIHPGDIIVSVDGQKPADFYDARSMIEKDIGKEVDIVVVRNGKQVELKNKVPAS